VRILVNTQHAAWGYTNLVKCLSASVLKDGAEWLLSTHAKPISKPGLETVVTEFQYAFIGYNIQHYFLSSSAKDFYRCNAGG
jgi:hypothetical protein